FGSARIWPMAFRDSAFGFQTSVEMRRGLLFAVAYGAALIFAALPFWLVHMPPPTDYSNHFARLFLLLHLQGDVALPRYYVVDWAPLPNLAADLIAVGFGRFMPLEDVGRLILSLSASMWLAGVVLINRTLFGRYSFWPLLALPFLYNMSMAMGFLSYYF